MVSLKSFFVDLHIHLGATLSGKPVKITASKSLTIENVLNEAADVKGLELVGIIDCHVPEIIEEIAQLILKGDLIERRQGGLCYKDKITFILGSEIEVYDKNSKGPIHVLVYFHDLKTMKRFSRWFSKRVTNNSLSSQRIYEDGIILQQQVKQLGGLFIPAHVFTPFKSLYGKGVANSLTEVFSAEMIDAIELGLSSDTMMADEIEELKSFTFLTNSDAHSLGKIAREYQTIKMVVPSFEELQMALKEEQGRKVVGNYGLDPRLGKYHQTACERCMIEIEDNALYECPSCGHPHLVKGVAARIKELSLNNNENIIKRIRPPYIHQIPLQFIPTLGPKTFEKLIQKFNTEMNIIHHATKLELEAVVSTKITEYILKARKGELQFNKGGGGKYGKVK